MPFLVIKNFSDKVMAATTTTIAKSETYQMLSSFFTVLSFIPKLDLFLSKLFTMLEKFSMAFLDGSNI